MDEALKQVLENYKGPKLPDSVIRQIAKFRDGDLADREANALIEMLGPDADELLFSGMEDEEGEVVDFEDNGLSEEERAWQAQYLAQEEELRKKEAEALQKIREAEIERVEQEVVIKKASRQLAIGIGTSALRLAKTMNTLAVEIDKRVQKDIGTISPAEMRAYVQSGSGLIEKATKALRVAMELERIEDKQFATTQGDEEEMSAEDALETMASLREVSEMIEEKE